MHNSTRYFDYTYRNIGQGLHTEEIDPNGVTLHFQNSANIRSLMSFIEEEITDHGYLTIDRLAEELEIILAQPVERTYRNAILGYTEMFKEEDVISAHKIRNSWEYEYVLTLPKGKQLIDMDVCIIEDPSKVKEN